MTAICVSSGPSQAKPGLAGVVTLGAIALGALANNWKIKWTVPYLVGLGVIDLNLANFCVVDPPADPGMTAADGLALLLPQFPGTAYFTAVTKLTQLLKRYAWYEFCQCTSGAQPVAPAPPAAPVGMPDPSPPVTGLQAGQCQQDSGSYGPWSSGAAAAVVPMGSAGYFRPAAGQTAMIAELTHQVAGATHSDLTVYLTTCQTEACGLGSFTSINTPLAQGQHTFWTIPVGPTDVKYLLTAAPTSGLATSDTIAAKVTQYCGGNAQSSPGCCPPDPALMGQLQQILSMVTLIQRQNVPFAYISGTAHAGLTNTGTINISGILGVRVDVTAGLGSLRTVGTLPPYYFGGGFLTFGTDDGYPSSYRVKHSPLLCLPARCSAYTHIEYDLPPGVTITITELLREP